MVYFDSGLGDQQKKKTPAQVVTLVVLAAVFGVMSILFYFFKIPAGSAVFGAMGLLLGGFSFGHAFTFQGQLRTVLSIVVAVSLILSVIGFMLGFAGIIG